MKLFVLASFSILCLTFSHAAEAPTTPTRGHAVTGTGANGGSSTTFKADPAEVAMVANAITDLGFELQMRLMKDQPDANVAISPITIVGVLGPLFQASDDKTREELAKLLKLDPKKIAPDRLQQIFAKGYRDLIENLGGEIALANGLFQSEDLKMNPAFQKIVAAYYKAKSEKVTFGSDGNAMDIINKFISDKTSGMIPKLLTEKPDGPLVVAAASYFDKNWKTIFPDKSQRDFTQSDGTKIPTSMMKVESNFPYYRGKGFKMVGLPYEGNSTMYVMVPDVDDNETPAAGISRLKDSLTGDHFREWVAGAKSAKVRVGLPEMTLSYSANLTKPLKEKAPALFRPGGLPGLGDPTLRVTDAITATRIEVTTKGTRAAAVAAAFTSRGISNDPYVYADVPSLYVIATGEPPVVLYSGVIQNPTK